MDTKTSEDMKHKLQANHTYKNKCNKDERGTIGKCITIVVMYVGQVVRSDAVEKQ